MCCCRNVLMSMHILSPLVSQVWEPSEAPAAPEHWQLLSDPPPPPEVSHRCGDIHGRAAKEAGHGRHGESNTLSVRQLVIQSICSSRSHSVPHTLMFLCHCIHTVFAESLLTGKSVFPADDRRLAVHRPRGGPPLLLAVCHHHHAGHLGHVLGRQF